MSWPRIVPFTEENLEEVKLFLDRWSGKDYLRQEDLKTILELSQNDGLNASIVAYIDDEIAGVRLTHAPGSVPQKNKGMTPEKWGVSPSEVGYFKSLFIAEDFRNQGIGKRLSKLSLSILKDMGAKAVLCHSWLESPGNSSQIYLQSLGFQEVQHHPKFWNDLDYLCTRCAPQRCICTSVEMIKYL